MLPDDRCSRLTRDLSLEDQRLAEDDRSILDGNIQFQSVRRSRPALEKERNNGEEQRIFVDENGHTKKKTDEHNDNERTNEEKTVQRVTVELQLQLGPLSLVDAA